MNFQFSGLILTKLCDLTKHLLLEVPQGAVHFLQIFLHPRLVFSSWPQHLYFLEHPWA